MVELAITIIMMIKKICQLLMFAAMIFYQNVIITGFNRMPQRHLPFNVPSFHPQVKLPWYKQKLTDSNFSYSDLFVMLNRKNSLLSNLGARINFIRSQPEILPESKLQMEVLEIFQRELKATGKSLVTVLQDLNQTLSSDYRSLEKIKHSCHMRLSDMREAAVFVEEDYNTILELEREMNSLHPNASLQSHYHVLNEIFSEISHAADNLESILQEHLFSDSRKVEGAEIETVVKLKEGGVFEHSLLHVQSNLEEQNGKSQDKRSQLQPPAEHHHEAEAQGGMSVLIDSSNNQYILSHPRDITVPIEDHRLVHDIIFLLLLSFLFGGLCSLFKVPSSFGYIFAGTVLGPTGYNCIESVVQVETIGEFGVIFIVFVVGLEFSPEKLRKVSC